MSATNGPRSFRLTWLALRVASAVSTSAAAPLAGRLWFTPWRLPLSDNALRRRRAWLMDAAEVVIDVDGQRLSGFAAGDGPTVLLVHGWGETAASLGAFVQPLKEAGYRVVGVDLPAHGSSSTGQTNAYQLSSAVKGIAGRVGPLHAVVAHSMGAHITTLALTEGLEVDAVVLIAPSVRLEHALVHFSRKLRLHSRASSALRATIERRFGKSVWNDLAGDALAHDLEVPALILHDLGDSEVPLSDAELLANAWPGAKLVTTDGLGHMRILRDEDAINRVVSFIGDASTSPAFSDGLTA